MLLAKRLRALITSQTEAERATTTLQQLRASLDEARRDAKARRSKLARLERKIPGPEAPAVLLRARGDALGRSSRAAAASERERIFEARTSCYAAAKREPLTTGVTRADFDGLSLWMPVDRGDQASLSDRLQKGALPLGDIVRVRDVALGSVVIDIGANVGALALPRVILGDAQMVLAAEPHPANYACLVRNVVENGLGGFVLPDHVALSDAEGESVLNDTPNIGTHYLAPDTRTPGIAVRTVTLDAWVTTHEIAFADVGFIKCDTQGWESRVLDGGSALLSQPHIVWQIEVHPGQLRRAGTPAPEFLARLADQFSHFIDLRGSGHRVRPTSQLLDSLSYLLVSHKERYTDLLLFGAHTA